MFDRTRIAFAKFFDNPNADMMGPAKPEHPVWFDWPCWGLAIGSDHRYKPRWYEKRAYVAGLRDAARIASSKEYIKTPIGRHVRRDGVRPVIKAIHAYVLDLLGLPADDSMFGD